MQTRIAVLGAAGRMGRATIAALAGQDDCRLVAAIVRRVDDGRLALDAAAGIFGTRAGVVAEQLPDAVEADVLIDFSGAGGFDEALRTCRERGIALVSGSTGLSEGQLAAARAASAAIPVLWSSNFSLGVALLRRLVATAAAALGPEFEAEIMEIHHRDKVDAPSGTALSLGRDIAQARGQDFDAVARFARQGSAGPRPAGEIGFAVARAADVVGEHTVLFAAAGERLELTHRATHRDLFARGAVQAARWLAGRSPGWYALADVLEPVAPTPP
jgi:4-hydroxy-tetrahydrodipicolinate reductase